MRVVLLLCLPGCMPVFEVAACYGPGECVSPRVCVERRCVAPAVDASIRDATADEGAAPPAPPAQVLAGERENESFGAVVAVLGDVDGDGYADLAVGAPTASPGTCPDACGRVYVYRGTASGVLAEPHAVVDGPEDQVAVRFGHTITSAGDVDRDGFADLVVGSLRGPAYIFHGAPDGLPSGGADRVATATLPPEALPRPARLVVGAGDVDGDGFDDVVVVGEDNAPSGRVCDGVATRVHGARATVAVHFGAPDGVGTARPAQRIDLPAVADDACRCPQGSPGNRWCGLAAAVAAGDLDGDRFSDLLLASATSEFGRGAIRIHRGGPEGVSATASEVVTGDCQRDELGYRVWTGGGVVLALADVPAESCLRLGRHGHLLRYEGSLRAAPAVAVAPANPDGAGRFDAVAVAGAADVFVANSRYDGGAGRVWRYAVEAGAFQRVPWTLAGVPGQSLGAPLAVYRPAPDGPAFLVVGGAALDADGAPLPGRRAVRLVALDP